MEDDVHPSPLEPASLVESGLGPSRGDRARPELEDLRPAAARGRPAARGARAPGSATPSKRRTSAMTRIANGVVLAAPVTTTRASAGSPMRPARTLRSSSCSRNGAPPEPERDERARAEREAYGRRKAEERRRGRGAAAAPATRGNESQFEAASPSVSARERERRPAPVEGALRRVRAAFGGGAGITASPGRGAVRCGPGRCRGRRRGRRPTGAGRATGASRGSSAP